jgi:hypothetical protein
MSTSTFKPAARRYPAQCVGIAVSDEAHALVLRPVALSDPDLTPEEDLPWLAHRQTKPLVIDLHGIELFNSDLARWLIHLTKMLPSHHFQLRNMTASVQSGMHLLGLDRLALPGGNGLTFRQ